MYNLRKFSFKLKQKHCNLLRKKRKHFDGWQSHYVIGYQHCEARAHEFQTGIQGDRPALKAKANAL